MKNDGWDGKIWDGIFSTFLESKGDLGIFDESMWVQKQRALAEISLERYFNEAKPGSLTITSDYMLPSVVASLSARDDPIHIVDFGGSLGSSYLSLRSSLTELQSLNYTIIEGEAICEVGAKIFNNLPEISFQTDFSGLNNVDIIHVASAMHYVDDWISLIKQFKACNPSYLIFSDLPAGNIETFVTTQTYGNGRIPVRFWNLDEFVVAVESMGFTINLKTRFSNKYLEKMTGFDKQHTLDFFTQLLFKSTFCGNE